jgi:outer membrane protein OmpA-like peptidoglycan-associated protein
MKLTALTTGLRALAVAAAPACATKKFVRTSVGEVNGKVDTLSGTVEQTQSRVTAAEGKIGQVDQKAEAAGKAASTAQNTATAAAAAAKTADAKAAEAAAKAAAVAATVDADKKRLLLEVTLSEDQGNFKFGSSELPDEAKVRIDDMINKLKADPKAVYFEIEGHTDDRGSVEGNKKLGLTRAETVKDYIYAQHKIPLHRMSVVSYGEANPVAPNKTREGRAQNRRVVIRILN